MFGALKWLENRERSAFSNSKRLDCRLLLEFSQVADYNQDAISWPTPIFRDFQAILRMWTSFAEELESLLLNYASFHDLVSANSYHMLMMGLLFDVPGYSAPVSNREAGRGRFDVQLAPEDPARDPLITLELKRAGQGSIWSRWHARRWRKLTNASTTPSPERPTRSAAASPSPPNPWP